MREFIFKVAITAVVQVRAETEARRAAGCCFLFLRSRLTVR